MAKKKNTTPELLKVMFGGEAQGNIWTSGKVLTAPDDFKPTYITWGDKPNADGTPISFCQGHAAAQEIEEIEEMKSNALYRKGVKSELRHQAIDSVNRLDIDDILDAL